MQKQSDEIPQFDPGSPDPGAMAFFLFLAVVAIYLAVRLAVHFLR